MFIERLWRSVKYEEIYLFEHSTIRDLENGFGKWFERYNDWRPHEALGNLTTGVVYVSGAIGGACRPRPSESRLAPPDFELRLAPISPPPYLSLAPAIITKQSQLPDGHRGPPQFSN